MTLIDEQPYPYIMQRSYKLQTKRNKQYTHTHRQTDNCRRVCCFSSDHNQAQDNQRKSTWTMYANDSHQTCSWPYANNMESNGRNKNERKCKRATDSSASQPRPHKSQQTTANSDAYGWGVGLIAPTVTSLRLISDQCFWNSRISKVLHLCVWSNLNQNKRSLLRLSRVPGWIQGWEERKVQGRGGRSRKEKKRGKTVKTERKQRNRHREGERERERVYCLKPCNYSYKRIIGGWPEGYIPIKAGHQLLLQTQQQQYNVFKKQKGGCP